MIIVEEINKLQKNCIKYAKSKNMSEEFIEYVKLTCNNLIITFSKIEEKLDDNQKYWLLQEIMEEIESIKKNYLAAFK